MPLDPARHLRTLLHALTLVLLMCMPVLAPAQDEPVPAQARELLRLLADPELQRWIARQDAATPPADAAATVGATSIATQIDAMRAHKQALIEAIPRLPDVVSGAVQALRTEMDAQGGLGVMLLLAAFIALGFGAEWLFWRASGAVRKSIIASHLDSTAARLRAALARLGFGSAWLGAFALGSIGAFLALDWPPVLRDLLLRLLVAVVLIRLALIVGRLLFAPGAARFRLIAMDTPAAQFWHRRLVAHVAWAASAMAVVGWLFTRTGDDGVTRLMAYQVYLVQLVLMLETLWRRPGPRDQRFRAINWLLSVALLVLLLLRVAGAFGLFWLGACVLLTYGAVRLVDALAAQLQRGQDAAPDVMPVPEVGVAATVRGLRLLLIVTAGLVLANNWGIDLPRLVTGDDLVVRLVRGAFSVVLIALAADLLWFVFKASMERRMAEAEAEGAAGPAHSGQASRLRTVLPILRNVSFVTLCVIAALMALSALVVDVAPLVAGAGVVVPKNA